MQIFGNIVLHLLYVEPCIKIARDWRNNEMVDHRGTDEEPLVDNFNKYWLLLLSQISRNV
ncbi:hypothetical protein ACRS7F_17190 [Brucella anthropi]|uniref:hypothetical protein n=1 Tax=Brucella anthropi TaxID=529 RepID=UPI003EE00548